MHMMMVQFESLAVLLSVISFSTACPIFGRIKVTQQLSDEVLTALARRSDSHHPDIVHRRTQGDPPLPELIPNTGPDNGGQGHGTLDKNAFLNPAGLSRVAYTDPGTGVSLTMADIIALYSAGLLPGLEQAPGVGQELCIWSMQSLPPPPFIEDPSLTVPRTVNGTEQTFHNYPIADMARVMDLCVLAGRRMQQHIADGDPSVMFGACTVGAEAAKACCELDIESPGEGSMCDEPRVNNAIAWPQAITMFKITPDTVDGFKELINNWRDVEHRPNIVWAFAPNSYTEPGEEEFGGIQGSVHPGWGANGGLRAKILQCNKIDPMFLQPPGPYGDFFFGPDAYSDDTNATTYSQLAFEEWDSLCGIPLGPANSDCVIDADVPSEPVSEVQQPSALLQFDEKCSYTQEYIAASATCGGNLNEALGDTSVSDAFEDMFDSGIAACGATFCESLTYTESNGAFGIDEAGFLFCGADGYRAPEVCEEGAIYMDALREFVRCALNTTSSVSTEKQLASQEAKSANADASLAACEGILACDEKTFDSVTEDWGTRFCVNFFQTLRNPLVNSNDEFAWVEDCGYSGDGSEESPLFQSCKALGFAGVAEQMMTPAPTPQVEGPIPGPSPTVESGPTSAAICLHWSIAVPLSVMVASLLV